MARKQARSVKVVATVASIATRRHLLEQTVASLIDQVDRLNVYLNGYQRVPPFLLHPKIPHTVLSRDAGWRGPEAKFFFVNPSCFKAPPALSDDDIHVTCDDDIVYPPDYVARMRAALERHPGSAVCVHGSILTTPFENYRASRMMFRFGEGLTRDVQVHIAGSGTMAYRLGDLPVRIARDFTWPKMADPLLAVAAKEWGVPIWCVEREAGWLKYMRPPAGTTIFEQRSGAGNHLAESELVRENGPWPDLEHAAADAFTKNPFAHVG